MGKIILLNDVQTLFDLAGLLPGGIDIPATKLGQEQSVQVSHHITKRYTIDRILTSDALCLVKLLHRLRADSKKRLERRISYSDNLRERNFGVLAGTKWPLQSEIFTYSRINPEGGESVTQCKNRAMSTFSRFCDRYQNEILLVISHPFVCQIITNVLTNRPLVNINLFWAEKGHYSILDTKDRQLLTQCNALEPE